MGGIRPYIATCFLSFVQIHPVSHNVCLSENVFQSYYSQLVSASQHRAYILSIVSGCVWSSLDFELIAFARKLRLNLVHCRQHATLFWTIEMHAVNCFSQTSSVDIYRLHVSNDTWQHLTTEWDSYTWRSLLMTSDHAILAILYLADWPVPTT